MKHIIQRLGAGLIYQIPENFYHLAGRVGPSMTYSYNQRYFSTKKKSIDIVNISDGRFADPTEDVIFIKLFGEESHKEILVNALNSFLGFTGKNAIVSVELNNSSLARPKIIGSKPSIAGAIDILCVTNTNKKIAVEMQGQKKNYFLAREQEYMARLISGQVTEKEVQNYHNKMLDTYIIVISRNNIFIGNTALKDQSLYELDVVPTVQQTSEVYPGNKMYWKFFELKKFALHNDSQNITKASPLKLQWLDFLLSCPRQTDIPEDRDDIIKDGYHIVDKMSWDPDERTMYWKNIVNQEDAARSFKEEGIEKGREEEKIKMLSGIKTAIENRLDHNLVKSLFPTFEESDLTKVEKYVSDNPHCTNDELAQHIGLLGILPENPED